MALNLEAEREPNSITLADMKKPSVIEGLVREGRPPFIAAFDFDGPLESAVCFIPESGETFKMSVDDAGQIAAIRNKLQRFS